MTKKQQVELILICGVLISVTITIAWLLREARNQALFSQSANTPVRIDRACRQRTRAGEGTRCEEKYAE